MHVRAAGALVFPLLMIEQHNTLSFWNRLPNIPRFVKIYCILIVLCHKMLVFPFLTLEQQAAFKESMINRLSNNINRNRLAAKILQVLFSSKYTQGL